MTRAREHDERPVRKSCATCASFRWVQPQVATCAAIGINVMPPPLDATGHDCERWTHRPGERLASEDMPS